MAKGLLGNVTAGGAGYMNPNIPPEVVKLLAEMGYAPDGSRVLGSAFDGLSTPQRLENLDNRISSDWQQMGFNPPPLPQSPPPPEENIFIGANSPMADTGPDPFGQETRARLDGINQRIDADMAAMNAPQMPQEAPRNPVGGMSYTPALPPPPPAPPPVAEVPKPKPRPRPETYVVRAGDNPTKIARKLGLTLRQLEEMNPGILKNARRLKIGSSLKV